MDDFTISHRIANELRNRDEALRGIPFERLVSWIGEYMKSTGLRMARHEMRRRAALGELWEHFPTTTWGGGSPEGHIDARKGSLFIRIEPGRAGETWIKTEDEGSTGWIEWDGEVP